MKLVKNNLLGIICGLIILVVLLNINKISTYLANSLVINPIIVDKSNNQYKKDYDFSYVQNTSNFMPFGYNDILNIFFSLTNLGITNFTFYCPNEYKDCMKDVEDIIDNKEILTYINYFVSPFNSFKDIKAKLYSSGQIDVTINYLYTEEEINSINKRASEILNEVIKDDMNDYNKIKAIHDYIINNTKYDVERNTNKESSYLSYKAYGPLIEGYATCNGYTDAMAIFLDRLGIKNFKIATELSQIEESGHVWNAVYIDNKWLHLDLTWDDPVSDNGTDYLQHKYFLITDEELRKADSGEVEIKDHIYNKSIYPEMK